MNEKVALVLGGNGGIGLEVIKSLAGKGINVCATYHSNKKDLEKLQGSNKGKVSSYQMDLSDEASINNAFDEISKEYNKIDIVVFSVTPPIKNKQILKMEWKDFQEHLDLQIKGLFYVIQNLKDQLEAKHKTKFIILLTEYCIGKPPAGLSHYVSAKYCLRGFAKSMAIEFAKYNCTVNMISPGMVDTNLISNLPPKLVEITSESNPLKRIAKAKDVANVVLFLSSEDSDYLNGVNITVNGGGIML
jgi:3-oxoacyl-[acyl-carrier protein] reductase